MVFNQIRRLYITLDATDQATQKLGQVNAATNITNQRMQAAAQKAQTFRSSLVAASFGATILAGAITTMVTKVKNVDRTFATVKATAGATTEQMQAIRNEASRIGAEMPVRMQEAANGFKQLSFAGFNTKQMLDSTNEVVEMSIAGNMKMGQAARTAASALNAFGLEAKEVGQVTNTMAAAFTSSAMNMRDLASSLQYVMPAANQVGSSLQVGAAAVGTLADQGLRGSRAGTALERVFRNLSESASEGGKALRKIGLTIDDVKNKAGDFKSLPVIIQRIADATNDMGNVEALNKMQNLFGARGARAAALLTSNTEKFVKKIGQTARAEINATMRSLETMSDEQLGSINEQLNRFTEGVQFNIDAETTTEEVVRQLNQASEQMSQEELQLAIGTSFSGISQKSAEIFAGDLKDDSKTIDEITEGINTMTTSADIAEEQMNSLWGRIEFVMGSLDALMMEAVRGMMPALTLFFDGLESVLRALTANKEIARGVGMAMITLLGIFVAIAAKSAVLAGYYYLVANAAFQSTTASYALAAAQKVQAAAQTALAASVNYVTTSLFGMTSAQVAATVKTKALTLAVKLQEAAMLLLQRRYWMALGALVGYNNAQKLQIWLSKQSSIVSAAQAAAMFLLGGAATAAGAAMTGLNLALEYFETMTLVGQVLSIVIGLVLLSGTILQLTGKFDVLGATMDALGAMFGWLGGIIHAAVIQPINMLIDALTWLWVLGEQLVGIGIDATFAAIGAVIREAKLETQQFINWFSQLPIIAPMISAAMGIVNDAMSLFSQTGEEAGSIAQWLSNAWSDLGLMIGDAIEGLLPWIRLLAAGFGLLMVGVERVKNAAKDAVEGGLIWIRDTAIETGQAIKSALMPPINFLTEGFGILFGMISTAVAPVMERINSLFGETGDKADSMLAPVIETITGLFAMFSSDVDTAKGRLAEIHPALGGVADTLAPFAVMFEYAAAGIGMLVSEADSMVSSIPSVDDVITGLQNTIQGMVEWIRTHFPSTVAVIEYIMSDIQWFAQGAIDVMNYWINTMTSYAASFESDVMEPMGEAADKLIGPFVHVFDMIMNLLGDITDSKLKKSMNQWGPIFGAVGDAVNTVTSFFGDLQERLGGIHPVVLAAGAAFFAITGPIGVIIAAIAGLVMKFDEIKAAIKGAVDTAMQMLANRFPFAAAMVQEAIDRTVKVTQQFMKVMGGIANFTKSVILPALAELSAAFGVWLGNAILGVADTVLTILFGAVMSVITIIKGIVAGIGILLDVLSPVINVLGAIAGAILKATGAFLILVGILTGAVVMAIVDVAAVIGGLLYATVIMVWELLERAMFGIAGLVGGLIDGLVIPIFQNFISLLGLVAGAIGFLIAYVAEMTGLFYDFLTAIWDVVTGAKTIEEALLGLARSARERFVPLLVDAFVNLPQMLTNAVIGIGEWAMGMIDDFIGWGKSLFPALVSGIKSNGPVLVDAMISELASIIPIMPSSDAEQGPLSNLTSWGASIIGTMAKGLLAAPLKLGDALLSVLPGGDMVKGALSGMADAGKAVAQGIGSGIKAAQDAVGGAIDTLMSDQSIQSKAKQLGSSLAGGIKKGLKGAANTIAKGYDEAMDLAGKGIEAGAGLVGGGIDKAGGVVSDVGGMMEKQGGVVGDIGSAVSGAGEAAQNVGGAISSGGEMANQTLTKTGDTINDVTEDITVQFDGEVHDAQKVADMVEEGIGTAKEEAQGEIDDALDMASDVGSDVVDGVGDVL